MIGKMNTQIVRTKILKFAVDNGNCQGDNQSWDIEVYSYRVDKKAWEKEYEVGNINNYAAIRKVTEGDMPAIKKIVGSSYPDKEDIRIIEEGEKYIEAEESINRD